MSMEPLDPNQYNRSTANKAMDDAITMALKDIHIYREMPGSMTVKIRERMLDLIMVLTSLHMKFSQEEFLHYIEIIRTIPSCMVEAGAVKPSFPPTRGSLYD